MATPPLVTPPAPAPPVICTAYFWFSPQIAGVKFNSILSITSSKDTIINRKWDFGDGEINPNPIDPTYLCKT